MIYSQKKTIKQNLGIIIKQLRKEKKISQQELSKKIIYNQSVISRIEKGYDQIPIELYHRCLAIFHVTYETNIELEFQINLLINQIFESYEILKILDFKVYLERVNELIKQNRNIIIYYDLLCMKMTCIYMLSRYNEAYELINQTKQFLPICHYKCQILHIVLKTQIIIINNKNLLNESQIPLRQDSEHGMIQYMWTKYYLSTFQYTKTLQKLNESIEIFKRLNNRQRVMRCELITNEICLKDDQFELVKYRVLNLLTDLEDIHPFDINKLYFQLSYCNYYLQEYENCLTYLGKINKEKYYDHRFINHLKNKTLFKLNSIESSQIDTEYFLDYLYFYYLDKPVDDNYYITIEKYIVDHFEDNYFKFEYRTYILELLNYYYKHKKYKKWLQTSELFHKVMHI